MGGCTSAGAGADAGYGCGGNDGATWGWFVGVGDEHGFGGIFDGEECAVGSELLSGVIAGRKGDFDRY